MKIIFTKYKKKYKLILAKIISSEDNLFNKIKNDITDNELSKFKAIKSNMRKLEWLGVRVLLKQILGSYNEILYYNSGKPYISNNCISISHTKGIIAIIVSSLPNTAIDVEAINEKIIKIAPKFMYESEINMFKKPDKINFIIANWCVKETIYKSYSKGNLDFKKHIKIKKAKIKKKGKILVAFKKPNVKQKFRIKYKIINFADEEEQYFLSWYKGDL